ncbi:hypothetical protein CBR_g18703 [Chara braunii]|uniref:DUF659 domain-containing protein n=1 Tax=Chara braunii TaxID=69332 RepID=A0A388KWD3_CHABU|nr:hypothetical protein CBR_g18703 [Chara braunii]|eukprot:GBG74292.1 hypothetical protein CBR_g18703 [Chara braunii]
MNSGETRTWRHDISGRGKGVPSVIDEALVDIHYNSDNKLEGKILDRMLRLEELHGPTPPMDPRRDEGGAGGVGQERGDEDVIDVDNMTRLSGPRGLGRPRGTKGRTSFTSCGASKAVSLRMRMCRLALERSGMPKTRRLLAPFYVTGATIMSDGRKSRDARPIVNFLAGGSRGVMMVGTMNREGERDQAADVLAHWIKVFDDFPPRWVNAICTGSASAYVAATNMIKGPEQRPEIGRITWLSCAVHVYNKMLSDIGLSSPWSKDIIVRGRAVVRFIKEHDAALHIFREESTQMGLVYPCETRFGSLFAMMERLLAVSSVAQLARWVRWHVWHDPWWDSMGVLVRIVEPVYDMPRTLDREGLHMSRIVQWTQDVTRDMAREVRALPSGVAHFIMLKVQARCVDLLEPVHAVAHLLYPSRRDLRYYEGVVNDYDARLVREAEMYILTQTGFSVASPDYEAACAQLRDFHTRRGGIEWVGRDKDMEAQRCTNDVETYEASCWWSKWGQCAPQLQAIALRIMYMWTCSSSAERSWAVHEAVHTKKAQQARVREGCKVGRDLGERPPSLSSASWPRFCIAMDGRRVHVGYRARHRDSAVVAGDGPQQVAGGPGEAETHDDSGDKGPKRGEERAGLADHPAGGPGEGDEWSDPEEVHRRSGGGDLFGGGDGNPFEREKPSSPGPHSVDTQAVHDSARSRGAESACGGGIAGQHPDHLRSEMASSGVVPPPSGELHQGSPPRGRLHRLVKGPRQRLEERLVGGHSSTKRVERVVERPTRRRTPPFGGDGRSPIQEAVETEGVGGGGDDRVSMGGDGGFSQSGDLGPPPGESDSWGDVSTGMQAVLQQISATQPKTFTPTMHRALGASPAEEFARLAAEERQRQLGTFTEMPPYTHAAGHVDQRKEIHYETQGEAAVPAASAGTQGEAAAGQGTSAGLHGEAASSGDGRAGTGGGEAAGMPGEAKGLNATAVTTPGDPGLEDI